MEKSPGHRLWDFRRDIFPLRNAELKARNNISPTPIKLRTHLYHATLLELSPDKRKPELLELRVSQQDYKASLFSG